MQLSGTSSSLGLPSLVAPDKEDIVEPIGLVEGDGADSEFGLGFRFGSWRRWRRKEGGGSKRGKGRLGGKVKG